MSLAADMRVLFHLACTPIKGATHHERLESFYAGQAHDYDAFRARLLPGRRELYERLDVPEGGVWVEMGGGTAANLQHLGARLARLSAVHVVDLSGSLLEIARRRIELSGWSNVVTHQHDATTFDLPGGADVVTFSYALTMIPDWFAALDNARRLLKPGGVLGVVDFFTPRKYRPSELPHHSWWSRSFWPLWFAADNVWLSPDHVPYLHRHFRCAEYHEGRARVPYLPLGKVPYYRFVGTV
jgi:S-adenosylmethionine-diacylgycerolhomoserine-N-methlytransferase